MTALPNPWISNPEPVDRKFRTTDPVSAVAPAPAPGDATADPLQDLIHEIFVGHAKLHEDFPRGFDPVQFYTDIIEMPLILQRLA